MPDQAALFVPLLGALNASLDGAHLVGPQHSLAELLIGTGKENVFSKRA
jgi:hypothetical protein